MHGELLIAAGPGEWRAALLEGGVPVELFVERGDRSETGSIHLGRVRGLVQALDAALIDIGGERPAFLPRGEIVPRGGRLDEGERVVVQLLREAQGGKAARATMRIALRGAFVELLVGRSGIAGGEALSAEERARLLSVWGETGATAFGLKLVEAAPIEALVAQVKVLCGRWRDILDRAARLAPPARLDPVTTFAAALARSLPAPPAHILVDEPAVLPEIRAAFPDSTARHEPEAEWPIDLDAVFDEALAPNLSLAGGGTVHFETTRAATLIDVDTGTHETGSLEGVGLAVNLTAAGAIARQIRLRNLGGGIVVDFVGLDSRTSRERVRAGLAEALAPDPARPQILGWTRLGHLELVRPRRNRPLAEALQERRAGGLVKTAITVAQEALRALRHEARTQPGRRWRLIVAPDVAAALAGGVAGALEQRFGRKIEIAVESGYDREHFEVAPR